jgi:hypothetical protein
VGGYLACAVFCGIDEEHPLFIHGGRDEDFHNPGLFLDSSIRRAQADCAEFMTRARPILERYAELHEDCAEEIEAISEQDFGMNFWYDRNGHGTGFWDRAREWGVPEGMLEELSQAAKAFGECYAEFTTPDRRARLCLA